MSVFGFMFGVMMMMRGVRELLLTLGAQKILGIFCCTPSVGGLIDGLWMPACREASPHLVVTFIGICWHFHGGVEASITFIWIR